MEYHGILEYIFYMEYMEYMEWELAKRLFWLKIEYFFKPIGDCTAMTVLTPEDAPICGCGPAVQRRPRRGLRPAPCGAAQRRFRGAGCGATLPGALDGTRGATGDGERRGRSAANGETLWEMEDSKWFHRKKHRDLLRHMGVEHDLTWFKPLKWGISGEETSRPWLFVALRPSGFSTHCGAVGTRPKRQPQAPRRWHFNAFYKVRKLESLHIWEVTYLTNSINFRIFFYALFDCRWVLLDAKRA